MANMWIRGLKLSNPTALRNVNFVYVPKGGTNKLSQTPAAKEIIGKGEDGDMGEKITSIFTGKSNSASSGLIKMFSSAATASVKGPKSPPINKGPPPKHDNQPVSDPKNRQEKPSKN